MFSFSYHTKIIVFNKKNNNTTGVIYIHHQNPLNSFKENIFPNEQVTRLFHGKLFFDFKFKLFFFF